MEPLMDETRCPNIWRRPRSRWSKKTSQIRRRQGGNRPLQPVINCFLLARGVRLVREARDDLCDLNCRRRGPTIHLSREICIPKCSHHHHSSVIAKTVNQAVQSPPASSQTGAPKTPSTSKATQTCVETLARTTQIMAPSAAPAT